MNVFKKIIFKDDIDRITLQIENHIKKNKTELFCKPSSTKRVLIENYLAILLAENKYAANEFLKKIEDSFSLYNKNDFTIGIESIRKKINKSIEDLFFNSAKASGREPIKINKNRINPLISNYLSGDYHIEWNDKGILIHIDKENNIFKFIDFYGEVEFFYSKDDLISKVNEILENKVINDSVYYRFYNKNEYQSFFSINECWNINKNDIFDKIIHDIKSKNKIFINENVSVELIESYSYKSIFVVTDKIEKTEKVLHIYVDNIEEAFTIAKSKYEQIIGHGEHLIYKMGTGWFISKIKKEVVKEFSQYTELLKPLESILSRVNLISSSETNYDFSNVHSLAGLCYGLSLNYLLEVRSNGIEGGNKYLFWIKENVSSYQSEKEIISNQFDSILFHSIQEYEILNLIKELKSIIFSQHFQMERFVKKVKYLVFDLSNPMEYSTILNKRGLEKSDIKNIEYNQDNVDAYLDSIMIHYDEYYSIIAFKNHAIAISYKKYSENNYKFALFDSSSELFESSDINSIKDMLSTKIDFYGAHEIDGKQYILFDEYKKSKIVNHQSVWNKNDVENNKGIAENLKKIGYILPFKEEIFGRVIHYSEQRELILEINRNNKLIEVIVKNVDVDEGLYLVKEVIDKIINNDEIGKVVIYKNEHDDIIVKEVEFGTYKEVKKRKGYIDFNDIYYRELININCYLLKGNKSTELNEIVSLIDKLQGNIYFEKLISGLSLINKINKFNESNENTSLANILNKVKDKLEDKLFYEKLLFGKETLLSLSEKNSFVAARLYQLMISEINEGIKGISNFIYNQIIESPYLSSDKKKGLMVLKVMIIRLNLNKIINI